jgi:AmpD protein
LEIDLTTGLLNVANYLSSPYYNERPEDVAIDMVVIHCIALPPATFGNSCIEAFFCGKLDFSADPYFETIKDLRVSAHLLISRQGAITQFVPFHQRAWHAGVSTFAGRGDCNDFSIGIELEGSDDLPYEKIQYEKLAAVTQALLNTYPAITQERIVGHSDIAPGRKTDPGKSFDWKYFTGLLTACSA